MKRALLAAAVVAALPASAQAAERTYVVMLKAKPIASYRGGTNGLAATSPQKTGARRISTTSSAARAYRSYLDGQQDAALKRAGGNPDVLYSYRTAFAGFAARLTPAQRSSLAHDKSVYRIFNNGKLKPQSVASDQTALDEASGFGDSAAYLGLPEGLWNTLGNSGNAGDGEIVGVIDTGITPQHPSFSGTGFTSPPDDWTGTCDVSQDPIQNDPAQFCNNKLIGARYYVEGFGADHLSAGSFLSPRDDDGHGTHTASTAAGDFGVDPSILGNDLGVNRISGIAPRARVAAYKVCWVGGDVADGCTDADSVMAIDDAVADGVNVINYSVGGTSSNVIDPTEFAFLGATDANVFVANSAGNDGPDPETVGTPTTVPWIMSVGADQPARTFTATAHIVPSTGAAFDITGASVTPALAAAKPIVDAAAAPATGKTSADSELCQVGTLDASKVTGKVVLCKRGTNDRIEKSKVVKDAGGVGMILYNPVPNEDTDDDIHYVPSVHVSNADGLKVKSAIAAGTTTATITKAAASKGADHVLAAFSSRGPQTAVPDLPKPDVVAPGVNILAGNSPNPALNTGEPSGQLFQAISGTSMASPHVAGAAALLKQEHPDWTVAEIKSALMLTADDSVKAEDGTSAATPFDQGSGEIDPTAAGDAELVLDENTDDYLFYLASADPDDFGGLGDGIAPSDLNLASISNSQVAGVFSTFREFTSTASTSKRWTVTADVPGFDISAGSGVAGFPTFNIDPGKTVDLSFFAQATTAKLGQYAYGTMTLSTAGQTLHIPISLRAVALAAPDPISYETDTPDGTFDFLAQSGFTGSLSSLGWGFAAPDVKAGQQIGPSPTGEPDPSGASDGNQVFDVTVPKDAQLLAERLENAPASTDLDEYLYYDANNDGTFSDDELVDASASSGAAESVDELLPPAGNYRLVVVGFTTDDPTSSYDVDTWLVNDSSPDDLSNPPAFDVSGDPFAVGTGDLIDATVDYTGLNAAGEYLGVATFHDSATPTLDNLIGAREVDVIEDTDTPTDQPTPEPTDEPTPEPTTTPEQPKPAIEVLSAALSKNRKLLKLKVILNRKARVDLAVKHKGLTKANVKSQVVTKGVHTLRFRLSHKLHKGSFRVAIKLKAGGKTGSASVRIRVRK